MVANPWWSPWALNRIIEPLMRSLRIQIPELAGMKAGDRALDICCGTGALALHYAKMGIIAAGIDLDPRVIEVAENKRRKLGLSNVSFQTANALDLPFKDNFFDYASISMSLHEKERVDRDRIISEMKRVVKKEGSLVFIDYKIPLPRIPISYTIKIIEFFAGRKHNRCFNDYVKQGGLDKLLNKNHLNKRKRGVFGPFVTIKTPNA
ncbi:MAG: methyltransferase domain-containing protein [Dehalococcoidia bacterium]|nr:methyltransferase domain-containing protein [Dehalococcoidia bacterium]MCK5653696.1 methyltransferase domain-containing protein [Dehalococcoidia bacterium]